MGSKERFVLVLVSSEDEFIYLLTPELWKVFKGYMADNLTDECAALSYLYEVRDEDEVKDCRCGTFKEMFSIASERKYKLRDGAVGFMY